MILSHAHRFVFIKGTKVAGTSVEMALAQICGPEDIVTPISPVDEARRLSSGARCQNYSDDAAAENAYRNGLLAMDKAALARSRAPNERFFNHMTLAMVEERYVGPLAGYRILGVERSPYSKVMSWLNMRFSDFRTRSFDDVSLAKPKKIQRHLDHLLENGAILKARNIGGYRHGDGRLTVEAMRYENLDAEFKALMASLDIADPPTLPHAKKGLMADTLDPLEFFSRPQLDRINLLFAEEFEAFGYAKL